MSSYPVKSLLLVQGRHSRHKWKAMGVRQRSQSKGSEESLYPKQLGHSVKEKSLSMGTESLGVGEKKEASVRR